MRTNVEIDDAVMAAAMKALGVKTKREAIDKALRAAIRREERLRAWDEMRGAGWEGDLDDMRTSKYLPAE